MIRRRAILITVIAVAVVLLAVPAGTHRRLQNAVARYADRLVAQGEKLTLPELVPPLPPAEANGGPALLAAAVKLPAFNFTNYPPAMRRVVPGRALVAWQQDPLPNEYSSNVWPALRAEIERCERTLELARAACGHPTLVLDLDYAAGFRMSWSHLTAFKNAARWLEAATVLELHQGRVARAATNLTALIRLAARGEQEPLLISALVRSAIVGIALPATWELLQSPELTEAQLAALQAEWQTMDFTGQMEAALAMERVLCRQMLEQMRASRQTALDLAAQFQQSPDSVLDELKALGRAILRDPAGGFREIVHRYPAYWHWRWWGSYRDELLVMQSIQTALDALRAARGSNQTEPLLPRFETAVAIVRKTPVSRWLGTDWTSLCESVLRRMVMVQTQRELVVTAIALKRYQSRHRRLPQALEALRPEFCPAIPRDSFDGQPLRYRPLPEGDFLLYSVGENRTDEGGIAEPPEGTHGRAWFQGRDLVWPLPASGTELRLFALQIELLHKAGRREPPRPIATNGLPENVLRELQRLARSHVLVLTNQPTHSP